MNRRAFFRIFTGALAALVAPLKLWGEEPPIDFPPNDHGLFDMADIEAAGGRTVMTQWIEISGPTEDVPVYRLRYVGETHPGGHMRGVWTIEETP